MAVAGSTTLYDTTITGTFNVGLMQIDSLTNAINVQGPSCYNKETNNKNTELCEDQKLSLMSTLTGNIDIFDGAIVLEPDGTITATEVVAGSYSVKSDSNTAGTAVLNAGETEVVVASEAVTDTKYFSHHNRV